MARITGLGDLFVQEVSEGVVFLRLHPDVVIGLNPDTDAAIDEEIVRWNNKFNTAITNQSAEMNLSRKDSYMMFRFLGVIGFLSRITLVCFVSNKYYPETPKGCKAAIELLPSQLVSALQTQQSYSCIWMGIHENDWIITVPSEGPVRDSDKFLQSFARKLKRWLEKARKTG